MIFDVENRPGVTIMISTRTVDMLGSTKLIYRGDVLVNGEPARYLDNDSAGRTLRRDMSSRTAPYTAEGLERLVAVLKRDVYDSELSR